MLGPWVCLLADIIIRKMARISDLRICTFNCRSLKNSIVDIRNLCNSHDIILIQEHWLMPFELDILSSISDNFPVYGLSAVDVSNGVVKDRSYGGTAILYSKQFANVISVINTYEPRLCAARIVTCVREQGSRTCTLAAPPVDIYCRKSK